MKKSHSIWIIIVAIFLIITAGLLACYPLISSRVNSKYQSLIETTYEEELEVLDKDDIQLAREEAQLYNECINVQYTLEDVRFAESTYDELLNLTSSGIMGYLEIPTISVMLPIYHGTDAETLEKGIGHLIGSSLPIGGEGTHSVLTGHSGTAGKRLFSDLENLACGDVFYLHVLDETLAYMVDGIHTVLPEETERLKAVEGEDFCTLVTCTPFGINSHRLLVRGTRIPYEEFTELPLPEEQVEGSESIWEQEYIRGLTMGCGVLAFFAALSLTLWFFPAGRKGKHGKK